MTTSTRIALAAATAAAGFWTAKAVTISVDGAESPVAGALFFVGLLSCLTAAAALGVALTQDRSRAIRVTTGIAGPILGGVLAFAVNAVVGLFHAPDPGRHWAWGEVNLWVLAALTLALAIRVAAGGRADRTTVQHQSLAH